ncbi:hypothetical protein MRB53_015767 [Persea americana]|uniref:Uncharacterized protein n=1 Tax=Persea americana TaxID=3435 RepID=A0ACC2M0S4_PERAE|nr:hypothetical protein MRB53_015767 [Persea americana]
MEDGAPNSTSGACVSPPPSRHCHALRLVLHFLSPFPCKIPSFPHLLNPPSPSILFLKQGDQVRKERKT